MAWTHEIGDSYPHPQNPLNVVAELKFTNSDTGEVIVTRPFGHDIDTTIKQNIRQMMDDILPTRDAALVNMKALKGQTLDLSLTAEEQATKDRQAAISEENRKIAEAQRSKLIADLGLTDVKASLG